MKPIVSLIAAMTSQRVIGKHGNMPWHLPEDLKRFRAVTFGHPVIMGRKTYESIGKPLHGRQNIIITRQKNYVAPKCQIFSNPQQAIASTQANEIFIIGGETIYRQTLISAHKIYLSILSPDFRVDGDAFFPEFSEETFILTYQESIKDSAIPYEYQIRTNKFFESSSAEIFSRKMIERGSGKS